MESLDPERWRRIKTLFDEAMERSPGERRAFLEAACSDDPSLVNDVEAMLAADAEAGRFLSIPAVERATKLLAAAGDAPDRAACTLPGYNVLRWVGEGGMGVVYEAEQITPIRRRVAVKVVRPGIDSGPILARFASEQQALALMNSPNIAQVFDAGRTDQGLPFFAMEFVEGRPITAYCDAERLDLPARLTLFVEVACSTRIRRGSSIVISSLPTFS